MAQIYAKNIPPVEKMQEVQRLVRDPQESKTDILRARELMKDYSPQTLLDKARKIAAARAPRGQAPVSTRPQMGVPASPPVAQPRRVFSEEGERILTAQGGGRAAIPQQIENVASKGRHGDTMLMHVNPQELRGLSSLLGPATINPDTGLPEAFAWWLPLIGAAIGGIGAAATGHDWKKGLLFGGLAGLGGAGALSLGGASTAAGGLGSTWGPLSGLFSSGAGASGAASTLSGAGAAPTLFNANQIAAINAANVGSAGAAIPSVVGPQLPVGAFQQAAQSVTGGIPPTLNLAPSVVETMTTPVAFTPPNMTMGGAEVVGGGRFPGMKPIFSDASQATLTGGPVPKTGERFFAGIPLDSASVSRPVDPSILQARELKHALRGAEYGTKAYQSPTEIPWWTKGLDWAKEHKLETGVGAALGLSALSQPRPQQFAGLPIKKVSGFDPSKFPTPKARKTIDDLTEDELKILAETGKFPGEKSSFFAKKGGIVALQPGGQIPYPGVPGGVNPHVGGIGYIQGYSGPKYEYVPESMQTQLRIVEEPSGGGAPGPSPFEFPDVDPFRSGLSSFNVEDRLARILGSSTVPQQFTLPSTPTTFPGSPTLPAIPASVPSANLQQGTSAMESLFSRFQQAQGDPIVDLVSESVAPAQQGGLIRLAVGGIGGLGPGTGGVSGGSFGLTGGSASGIAGGIGGSGIGTGITGGLGTMTVTPGLSRTGPIAGPPGGEAQVFSKTKGVPYTVTGGDIAEAETLNAIGKILGGEAEGAQAIAQTVASPIGTFLGQMMSQSTPASVASSRAYLASPKGKAQVAAESAGVTQRGDPSEGDPYHVPNPILGEGPMAAGGDPFPFIKQGGMVGLALGGNPVFAGHLQGRGDGMSDQIPFRVVPQTPQDIPNAPDMAVLSTDEYVFPADAVSMLGNGSSNAGAKILDDAVKRVRQASIGTPKQIKEIDGQSVLGGALTT